jgi:hypothetical protein
MAEICEDIKVNLVEAVGNLGITLSSENTRINHTESGTLDVSSNGTINISSSYINIGIDAKNENQTTDEPSEINIKGSQGTANVEAGSIKIECGSGGEGLNSNGGELSIISGDGEGTGTGGQINITAGNGKSGDGGDIYIQAGNSNNNNQNGANGGDIIIESGNGGTKCGDVNVWLGPSDTNGGVNIPIFGPTGRFNINYGAFRLAIFNDTVIRDLRIPTPQKGDMCFVNDKIHVHNGTAWKILAFEP